MLNILFQFQYICLCKIFYLFYSLGSYGGSLGGFGGGLGGLGGGLASYG